jgi:hypothetical protein
VVEAKVLIERPEKDEVPDWETTVPVVVTPMKEAFPPVRFPPFSVRYVKDAPAPVEVPEMLRVPVPVMEPAVRTPMFAAGPEEEPVTLPVRFPVTFPESVPVMFVAETFEALMFPA